MKNPAQARATHALTVAPALAPSGALVNQINAFLRLYLNSKSKHLSGFEQVSDLAWTISAPKLDDTALAKLVHEVQNALFADPARGQVHLSRVQEQVAEAASSWESLAHVTSETLGQDELEQDASPSAETDESASDEAGPTDQNSSEADEVQGAHVALDAFRSEMKSIAEAIRAQTEQTDQVLDRFRNGVGDALRDLDTRADGVMTKFDDTAERVDSAADKLDEATQRHNEATRDGIETLNREAADALGAVVRASEQLTNQALETAANPPQLVDPDLSERLSKLAGVTEGTLSALAEGHKAQAEAFLQGQRAQTEAISQTREAQAELLDKMGAPVDSVAISAAVIQGIRPALDNSQLADQLREAVTIALGKVECAIEEAGEAANTTPALLDLGARLTQQIDTVLGAVRETGSTAAISALASHVNEQFAKLIGLAEDDKASQILRGLEARLASQIDGVRTKVEAANPAGLQDDIKALETSVQSQIQGVSDLISQAASGDALADLETGLMEKLEQVRQEAELSGSVETISQLGDSLLERFEELRKDVEQSGSIEAVSQLGDSLLDKMEDVRQEIELLDASGDIKALSQHVTGLIEKSIEASADLPDEAALDLVETRLTDAIEIVRQDIEMLSVKAELDTLERALAGKFETVLAGFEGLAGSGDVDAIKSALSEAIAPVFSAAQAETALGELEDRLASKIDDARLVAERADNSEAIAALDLKISSQLDDLLFKAENLDPNAKLVELKQTINQRLDETANTLVSRGYQDAAFKALEVKLGEQLDGLLFVAENLDPGFKLIEIKELLLERLDAIFAATSDDKALEALAEAETRLSEKIEASVTRADNSAAISTLEAKLNARFDAVLAQAEAGDQSEQINDLEHRLVETLETAQDSVAEKAETALNNLEARLSDQIDQAMAKADQGETVEALKEVEARLADKLDDVRITAELTDASDLIKALEDRLIEKLDQGFGDVSSRVESGVETLSEVANPQGALTDMEARICSKISGAVETLERLGSGLLSAQDDAEVKREALGEQLKSIEERLSNDDQVELRNAIEALSQDISSGFAASDEAQQAQSEALAVRLEASIETIARNETAVRVHLEDLVVRMEALDRALAEETPVEVHVDHAALGEQLGEQVTASVSQANSALEDVVRHAASQSIDAGGFERLASTIKALETRIEDAIRTSDLERAKTEGKSQAAAMGASAAMTAIVRQIGEDGEALASTARALAEANESAWSAIKDIREASSEVRLAAFEVSQSAEADPFDTRVDAAAAWDASALDLKALKDQDSQDAGQDGLSAQLDQAQDWDVSQLERSALPKPHDQDSPALSDAQLDARLEAAQDWSADSAASQTGEPSTEAFDARLATAGQWDGGASVDAKSLTSSGTATSIEPPSVERQSLNSIHAQTAQGFDPEAVISTSGLSYKDDTQIALSHTFRGLASVVDELAEYAKSLAAIKLGAPGDQAGSPSGAVDRKRMETLLSGFNEVLAQLNSHAERAIPEDTPRQAGLNEEDIARLASAIAARLPAPAAPATETIEACIADLRQASSLMLDSQAGSSPVEIQGSSDLAEKLSEIAIESRALREAISIQTEELLEFKNTTNINELYNLAERMERASKACAHQSSEFVAVAAVISEEINTNNNPTAKAV